MKKIFAILHEPASYTVDRNRQVYDKRGVGYCYMHAESLAKSLNENREIRALSDMSTFALIKRLRDILRENDVIIMNGYTGKVFLALYGLNLYYRRSIGLDSDTPLYIPPNPLKSFLKSAYLSTIFRDKRMYGLAGGSKSHKELFRHYGMDEERICLMPMVVNNEYFCCERIREDHPFRYLYVGRIIEVKNIRLMIEAFLKAFENRPDVELRIVGKGDLLESLQKEYQAFNQIVFAGAKYGDDLLQEYRDASAFVLPSSFEPWGLVVNEAMAAGLPVIVSNQVGAAYDLVEGKQTGFVFRYDDADDLKDKMIRLEEDKDLYRQYARNAFHRVNDEWGYAFYSKCLNEFIEKASLEK